MTNGSIDTFVVDLPIHDEQLGCSRWIGKSIGVIWMLKKLKLKFTKAKIVT